MGQFYIFRTNCAIASGTRGNMLRGFLRISRGGNDLKSPKCLMLLAHNSPQLNTFMSVGNLLQCFRRKLIQFEWSKTALNLVMSRFITDQVMFRSEDAAQFCLCKNSTNCLLSMNKSARRCVFCTVSKHDIFSGIPHSSVKTYIELR